jgi:small conductance mechanosensitive channel
MHDPITNLFSIPVAFAQTDKVAGVATETTSQIQNLINSVIAALPLWITGFLIVILSFFLARFVRNAVENKMTAAGMEEEHKEIQIVSGRVTSAIVITLGATVGLKIAGIDLTAIIAAAAFGVGFAMQDIIMNFLAGIIVLLQKQFTIGDWIVVNGTAGIVKEIQSRYTVIKKFDGTKVIIPNSDLFKNQVTSLTGNPFRRFQIDIGVDLYYDLKETIDLVYASIAKVPKILQSPKPSIIVTQPGTFYNNLRIRCWVDSKKGVLRPISALMRQIHKDFYAKGWSWPYPTQQLIMDKDIHPNVAEKGSNYVNRHQSAKAPAFFPQQTAVQTMQAPLPNAPGVIAQAVNPPIIFQKIDAGPDSDRVNIPGLSAPVFQNPPVNPPAPPQNQFAYPPPNQPAFSPALQPVPPASSAAPAWLQQTAQNAFPTAENATQQAQSGSLISQIPMGISVQPQNDPEPQLKIEIPMGILPQPLSVLPEQQIPPSATA